MTIEHNIVQYRENYINFSVEILAVTILTIYALHIVFTLLSPPEGETRLYRIKKMPVLTTVTMFAYQLHDTSSSKLFYPIFLKF
jgi:hypothetical protein